MKLISILLLFISLTFANQEKIEINFKNLEISELIKMVSKISNKNILLTTTIKGKVNFISIKPITKDQIYDLLINVLKNKGYTLMDSNSGFLHVVRSSDAPRESPPLKGKSKLNQIQTDIVGIKNLTAAQVLSQVRFLLSKYGKITVSKEANSLIMTDYPSNLKSVRELINKLDSQKSMTIKFVVLENSRVTAVLPKIKSIAHNIYNQKMPSQKVTLFSDDGTNTLIIISTQKIIDDLLLHVKKLDKKDEVSHRSLHIVHLKNSDAKTMATTLKSIISNKPVVKKKKTVVDNKKPTFTAEEETNILMIYASTEEFKEIQTIINTLDIPRQQVYVSAKIVEISTNKSKVIGARYGLLGGTANSSGLYTLNTNMGGSTLVSEVSSLLGSDLPTITKGLALGASLSLLNDNGAADIISEPSLLCINNLESSIYVGKTESIITQSNVGSSATDVNQNKYTREDIGLTLKVKPRISSDKKVLLEVKVTLEDVIPNSAEGLPTTTKRDVVTTAIVKNGESIIIGGLVKDKVSKNIHKIPLLGDIPILGYLFKETTDNHDKINLVIILTPYIVDNKLGVSSLREALAKLNLIEQKFAKKIKDKKAKEEKNAD